MKMKARGEQKGRGSLQDMHAHLACLSEECGSGLSAQERLKLGRQELVYRKQAGVQTIYSCGTPEEWTFMRRLLAWENGGAGQKTGAEDPEGVTEGICPAEAVLSFGIHPWYSDRFVPNDYADCFRSCSMIGEIGMDAVWCSIPLLTQQKVFERQLDMAAGLGKPVILHTKGQEREIAGLLQGFPQKFCVHWYSGDIETFDRLLELGSYFTLGPDFAKTYGSQEAGTVGTDEAAACGSAPDARLQEESDRASAALYHHMAETLPADRILLETDGIAAVAWALGEKTARFDMVPAVLTENLRCISQIKGMPQEAVQRQLLDNKRRFLQVCP